MRVKFFIVPWLWRKMAFMKRKTVKFSVDIQICQLSDVPLVNAVVFAKLRLLEGGSFEDTTERVEVKNHSASFGKRSTFAVRIPCEQSSGTLEKCLCRISIRKEQKGGKSFYKLGYVDVNLSEFAASGIEGISRSYLLNGYTTNQRLDNSKVCVKVVMCHQSADPFFRVPRLSNFGVRDDGVLNPEAYKAHDPPQDSDSEESGIHPKAIVHNDDCTSAASSSAVDEVVNERKVTTQTVNHPNEIQPRRFSQDRSAQRIQSTRMNADNIIDRIIAECRVSEESCEAEQNQGLSLEKFLDKNGKPLMTKLPNKRMSYTPEHFKEERHLL